MCGAVSMKVQHISEINEKRSKSNEERKTGAGVYPYIPKQQNRNGAAFRAVLDEVHKKGLKK